MSAPARPAAAGSAGYLAVLALPGALRAFLPAMVGRLSFGMVTLALLLLIQSATGSFAAAGLATGAFGLANVLASPARARLVDARGQRPVLVALATGHALALVGLLASVRADAPTAVVVAAAAAAGLCLPPLGAAMRVLWAASAPDVRMRTRAYSLDTVGEDLAFTVGPLLVALLVAVADPTAAVLVSGCATVAGALGMTSAPLSRARGARRVAATAVVREPGAPAPVARGRRWTLRDEDPLRQPLVVPVLVTLVGVGAVFGAVEVAAAALAERAGDAALSGPLLAAFAAGSAVGGLAYGARAWRVPTRIRLVAVTAAMVAATGVTAAVTSHLPGAPGPLALVAVAGLLALVGLFLAPAMVTGYLLADERTTDAVRTEASAWVNTAVNTGVALAAAGVGAVVDAAGPGSGLAVGTAGALVLAALAMPALLRRRAAAEPT